MTDTHAIPTLAEFQKLQAKLAQHSEIIASHGAELDNHATRLTTLEAEAPTVDIDPPAEPAAPEPVRPVDPTMATDTIDAGDVIKTLDKGDRAILPGGAIIKGGIVTDSQSVEMLCEDGDRPIIIPDKGQDAFVATSDHIEKLDIEGIGFLSEHRDTAKGISVILNNKDGKYARGVRIYNCKFENFDTATYLVDQWARKQPLGAPGRIWFGFTANIVGPCYGSDNHSIGLRVDGPAEGCYADYNAFDQIGWLVRGDRNKMSHPIYASDFGARMSASYNLFSRAAANASQFRAGIEEFLWNICTECSLGPWIDERGGRIEDNVVLDQTDISDNDIRGHGFILSGGQTVLRNIAARRGGGMKRHPAFTGIRDAEAFKNNTAVAWAVDHYNFEVDGREYTDIGSNRTLTADPGVPRFSEDLRNAFMQRERGEAYPGTNDFIEQCQEAVA